jgi:hypothetical protein
VLLLVEREMILCAGPARVGWGEGSFAQGARRLAHRVSRLDHLPDCRAQEGCSNSGELPAPIPGLAIVAPIGAPNQAAPPMHQVEAVLAAGDDSIRAFDDATGHLHDRLIEIGIGSDHIHRLTSTPALVTGTVEPATQGLLLRRIAGLAPAAGGGCLVFITSHGAPERGLVLTRQNEYLGPGDLDAALQAGCAAAPTVVIASGCFSGNFASGRMARPNRIVLTAARADRPSFGCGANNTYTFFDQCLLGALDGAASWRVVFERTRGCVATLESDMQARPSEPQAFFGAAVAELVPPWVDSGADDRFLAAADRHYTVAALPIDPDLRNRNSTSLARYATAPGPKAMAISPDGGFVNWRSDAGNGRLTTADVRRLALQLCEWQDGGACTLYAEGDAVAAPLPSGVYRLERQSLIRSGALDLGRVAFVPEAGRPALAAYENLRRPKVLALNPEKGVIGLGSGSTATEARRKALAQCRTAASPLDCVVYAVDDRVVLGYRK